MVTVEKKLGRNLRIERKLIAIVAAANLANLFFFFFLVPQFKNVIIFFSLYSKLNYQETEIEFVRWNCRGFDSQAGRIVASF